jgi:uncharacterized membrane protein
MTPVVKSTQHSSGAWPLLLLVSIIAILIRLPYLSQPMRFDESLTFVKYASQPLSTALSTYEEPNNHLFNTFLVHVMSVAFGNHPWVLRLPAFIAGILLIPAIYWTTHSFYSKRAALLAASLAAVSLTLVEYSVNARGYTLIALIFVVELGLAQSLKRQNWRVGWLLFGVLAAIGFYTIPVMLYPIGIVALWLLFSLLTEVKGTQRWTSVLHFTVSLALGALLTILLYLPVIRNEGLRAIVGNEFVEPLPAGEFYQALPRIFQEVATFVNRGYEPFIQIVLAVGMVTSLLLHRRLSHDRFHLLVVALIWLFPLLVFQRVIPFDRTWIFLIPLYLMLSAAGLAALLRDNFAFYSSIVVLTVSIGLSLIRSGAVYTSTQTALAPNAEAIALYLIDILEPQDEILAPIPLDAPIQYYLNYHGYAGDPVRNEYETFWVDLRSSSNRQIYVVGTTPGDTDAFLTALHLPPPSFDITLETIHLFPQQVLQQLHLPTLPQGILFSDDFEGDLLTSWNFHRSDPVLVDHNNGHALDIRTGESWAEITLDGGARWSDYAVSLEVEVIEASSDYEDLYVHVRNNYEIGSYIVSINTSDDRISFSRELNREWRGFLTQTHMPLQTNQWYLLQVQVKDNTLQAQIEGRGEVSIQDELLTQGSMRLILPPYVRVRLDNLVVTDLSREQMFDPGS